LGKLTDDTDYETKMKNLNEELLNLKEEYREMGKEHKVKEMGQMEQHQKLVTAEEENLRLKRILIAVKNNKSPFEGLDNEAELLESAQKEVNSYESAIKSEERRHKQHLRKFQYHP
jgi:hypothetical protein